jgi:predicted transcriptional regulator
VGLFLILLYVVHGAMASEDPQNIAEFHYLHGFEASGLFQGECQVTGFRFDTGSPGSLPVHASSLSMVLFQTWRNSTIAQLDGIYRHEAVVTAERTHTAIDLSGSHVELSWGPGSHLMLIDDYYEAPSFFDGPNGLTTGFEAEEMTSFAPQTHPSAGPGYYYVERDGLYWQLQSGLAGPSRWVTWSQESTTIHGDGYLLFDQIHLKGPDIDLELPAYRQYFREYETPVSYRSVILHTHALIYAQGLKIDIHNDQGNLACKDMTWEGKGSVTYRQATGHVSLQGDDHAFQDRQFTLDGQFRNEEAVAVSEQPWGNRLQVDTVSQGEFLSAADYQTQSPATHHLWQTAGKVSLLASIAGALALSWKILPWLITAFTRVAKEEALEHPVRATLLSAAQDRPGTPFIELVRMTGHSYSTIQHHARLLERLEIITLYRIGREACVFPKGTPRAEAEKQALMRREPVRFLVQNIHEGGTPLRAIRDRLQEEFQRGPSWATRIVKDAEKTGLVVRHRDASGVRLCVP